MTNRREFLKGSIATASAAALTGVLPAVAAEKTLTGIVYTRQNPGKWAQKVGSHSPSINLSGSRVTLVTEHPMSAKHYIVRHTLVLADGTVVGGKAFEPTDEKAVSVYQLPDGYKGKIFATSFCNHHDFWVNEKVV